jgi:hypothetical protein
VHRTVRGDGQKHRTNYGAAELSVFDGAASDRQLHIAGAKGAGGGRVSAGTIDPPGGLSGIGSADRKSVCRKEFRYLDFRLDSVVKEDRGLDRPGSSFSRHCPAPWALRRWSSSRVAPTDGRIDRRARPSWSTPARAMTRSARTSCAILYDSDAYNDDLPYFAAVGDMRHLVLPYAFDTNDMQFFHTNRFSGAVDFAAYVIDAFDWLHREGAHAPAAAVGERNSLSRTDSPAEGTGFEPSVPRQEKWSMPSSSDQTRVGRTLTLGGSAESSLEGRDIELSVSPKDIRTSPYDLCANRSDRRQLGKGTDGSNPLPSASQSALSSELWRCIRRSAGFRGCLRDVIRDAPAANLRSLPLFLCRALMQSHLGKAAPFCNDTRGRSRDHGPRSIRLPTTNIVALSTSAIRSTPRCAAVSADWSEVQPQKLIGVTRPQIANSASDDNIKVFGTILERGHRVGRRFPRPQDPVLATGPF